MTTTDADEDRSSRFMPSPADVERIELFQQARAERLAFRIITARNALRRGENATYVLALLDADTEAAQ